MINIVTAAIIIFHLLNTLLLNTLAEINEQKFKFDLVFIDNEIAEKGFSKIKPLFQKK